jgi:cellulose synthase/poly-beta-1,6-N-acetylglucosamine synthase-like glycosyltransferase
MSALRPFCSVVVPAYNAEKLLPRALQALRASDFPSDRWELIVVDDGSTDGTAEVAAPFVDSIVRLPGRPRGPAYARNRGVEVARGDVIAFFDADVLVHPDTLRRFVEILQAEPTVGAVIGAYDLNPPAAGFISQYRNLVHHYVHSRNAGDVETFWAGAGVVRRDLFVEIGCFDEWHFARPQIEDIELGARIRRSGARILLRPDIQVTHLKRWTLLNVIRTDTMDRGIPWARLLTHRGAMMSTGTLNLRWTEKLSTALVWLALGLVVVAGVLRDARPVVAALIALAIVALVNVPLWRFFARVRGPLFALGAIPLHFLYHVNNGLSFLVGYFLVHLVGPPLPDPTTEAFAEIGVKRWPPVPSRDSPSSWTADAPKSNGGAG